MTTAAGRATVHDITMSVVVDDGTYWPEGLAEQAAHVAHLEGDTLSTGHLLLALFTAAAHSVLGVRVTAASTACTGEVDA